MKKLIRSYIGFQVFFSLLLWIPIYYEYQLRIGLNESQIFKIQSLYYIAFCLLEIPTGMIADRLGYRRCMRWGSLVLIVANALPIFERSYQGFLLHFMLIALSRSLISGASSAYLYESLEHQGRVDLYKDAEGKARAYGLVAKIVCWAGVGHLMNWHLTLPYSLTVLSAIIAFVFSLSMPPLQSDAKASAEASTVTKRPPFLPQLLNTIKIAATTPFLLLVMFQGIALFVLGRIVQVNLFQPILTSKALGMTSFGLIMSLMTVFEAIGSYYPSQLRRFFGDLNAVYATTLAIAASIVLIPYLGAIGAISSLLVFSFVSGIAFPIQKQLINDAIPTGASRATLLSLESIVDRAVCAWVATLLAFATTSTEHLNQFLIQSAAATAASVFLLIALHKVARRYATSKAK